MNNIILIKIRVVPLIIWFLKESMLVNFIYKFGIFLICCNFFQFCHVCDMSDDTPQYAEILSTAFITTMIKVDHEDTHNQQINMPLQLRRNGIYE